MPRLSSGLDIVRKGLGRYEIATIQTTAIDKDAGLLRLTTVLAHSSGEWISSEWPVCLIADIASAQRMGAALTYARRYALFTLVGIAGEDDLDAPDLDATSKTRFEEPPRSAHRSQSTGDAAGAARACAGAKLAVRSAGPVLAADRSAILRERLLGQLVAIHSTDEAALWARLNLSASEVRALGKTVRLRDKEHRKFVSQQACLVCGRAPPDPHHLTFMQPRALGHRVSDEFTVPVCRIHHRELHRQRDEVAWWGKFSIDPLPVALRLWQHTRLNGNELAPSENITPSQAAQNLDMSVQDRAGTNDQARADVEGAVFKDGRRA